MTHRTVCDHYIRCCGRGSTCKHCGGDLLLQAFADSVCPECHNLTECRVDRCPNQVIATEDSSCLCALHRKFMCSVHNIYLKDHNGWCPECTPLKPCVIPWCANVTPAKYPYCLSCHHASPGPLPLPRPGCVPPQVYYYHH